VADSRSRVILDPSFLFTEEALGWMEISGLGEYLVVSESLRRRLDDPEWLIEELAAHGVPVLNVDLIVAVRNALEQNDIATFSYEAAREREQLPPGAEVVCGNLLESEEPLADALADEWAFVTSESLAVVVERAGDTLGALSGLEQMSSGSPSTR
jgi:hypothetical protein